MVVFNAYPTPLKILALFLVYKQFYKLKALYLHIFTDADTDADVMETQL